MTRESTNVYIKRRGRVPPYNVARRFFVTCGQPEQLRAVVANSRRRGGVGPAVSLVEHVAGMTAPLPVAAVAAAEAESSCLCMFA